MEEVCQKSDFAGQIVATPCPDCGHTNVLHPGVHNPKLDECLVCRLEATLAAKEMHDG